MTLRAKKKQLIAAALAAALAFGTAVPAIVAAQTVLAAGTSSEAADIWNGKYDFGWYKDEDKEVYAIVNARQMAGLSALTNGLYKKTKNGYQYDKDGKSEKISFQGKTFRLARSVDLDGRPWIPIGNSEDGTSGGFSGTFLGENHVVYNLSIKDGESFQGLFGYADGSSHLEGIHIDNCKISADDCTGALAGKSAGEVENCSSAGTIISEGDQIGGLIGFASGDITGCYSTIPVKGEGAVGGLVGQTAQGAELKDCYTKGSVSGEKEYVGGLIGYSEGARLENCYSTSAVQGKESAGGLIGAVKGTNSLTDSYFSGSVQGDDNVGGLIGNIPDTGTRIESSYSSGSVVGKEQVGGIVGSLGNKGSRIDSSYSSGTIQGEDYVGGVVGISHGILEECSSRGNVIGNDHVGGVAGRLEESSANGCFSTASVSGNEKVGGVIGDTDNKAQIHSSYGAGTVKGEDYVGGLVGASWNTIDQSHARGNVTGTGEYVGGLAGYTEGEISSCYASGNVSGKDWVGGLIGVAYANTVHDCAATGNVTMTNGEDSAVGGVVGGMFGNMENCYSGGTVTGKDPVYGAMGGIVGTIYGNMNHCVALNPSIQGGGNLQGRVAGEYGIHPTTKTSGTIEECYAYRDMTVNGRTVRDDDTLPEESLNGKGMANTAFNGSFWSQHFGDGKSPWKLPDRTEMGIPVLEDMQEDQDRFIPVLESNVKLDTKTVDMMGLKTTYQFLVKGNSDAQNIRAESEDKAIAEVKLADSGDPRGAKYEITAKKEGSTYIKVTYRGQTSYLKVNVRDITGSITLDTSNYQMSPGDTYTIGSVIKDASGKVLTGKQTDDLVASGKLVVRDSRTGSIVSLRKLENGNYRVTGRREGTTYIIYEINGTHASVKVDVKQGTKPHGSAVRNTSYFFKKDTGKTNK